MPYNTTQHNLTPERRKHHRCKTLQDIFVSIDSRPLQIGRIINIGKGGLAFLYVDNEQPIITYSRMDIFPANDGFRLAEIPYKVVSEFELNGKPYSQDLKLRQRCIAFGQLTQFQNASLDFFLDNYTIDQFSIGTRNTSQDVTKLKPYL